MIRPTQIKLMPEYSVELPLWSETGLVEDDLGLSDDLDGDLRAWQEFFDDHHRPDTGWDDPAHAAQFQETAQTLEARLRAELGPEVRVFTDLWTSPKTPAGRSRPRWARLESSAVDVDLRKGLGCCGGDDRDPLARLTKSWLLDQRPRLPAPA